MSLDLIFNAKKISVNSILLSCDAAGFELSASRQILDAHLRDVLCSVKNPLNVPKKDYDIDAYSVALFTHRAWPESQVLTIKKDDKSIGLLFSMQALSSPEGVLQDNPRHNSYAFIALQKLCLGNVVGYKKEFAITLGEVYEIGDFYSEDTVVAIFMNSMFHDGSDFAEMLHLYLPSFSKYDMHLQLSASHIPSDVRDDFAGTVPFPIEEGRSNLTLKPISMSLSADCREFLNKLLLEIDPYEKHPAFRFFMQYQMFELIMQMVYQDCLKEFIDLSGEDKFSDPSAMKDLADALYKSLNEKSRLYVIFQANSKALSSQFSILKQRCNEALAACDIPQESEPNTALYKVRNLLFHSFSKVEQIGHDLSAVADQLIKVICDLSLAYVHPGSVLKVKEADTAS